ncbi:hypothetical protein BY996DRAFT_4585369 [Phakopsora pachyrhizi]|uniref:Uncharacterized protein n=1 Tax=Phakopsora pachyrhizi TaxID=170000 RepID=A0AAV0BNM7_PHAPC|nr:hypothetical protein BY996DRAFT_4585369 [Phakopsora pachyrhizi]CAH7687165.1 hypothetical protein PPACK8108_LOCUS21902 [Phakopsora pachyrhizi]
MVRDSSNFIIPRVSLRTPAFIGPVTLGACALLASLFTAPFGEEFRLVRLQDPTYTGAVGIWGVCTEFHTENATTANPNATLTGNATFDAIVHKQGKHGSCSSATFGYSFSVPVNSTGLAGMPLPDSGSLGVNVSPGAVAGSDITWVEVMTSSQSSILAVHIVAALLPVLGLLLLLIPYKPFEDSSPALHSFLKSGSVSLVLVLLGSVLSVISFVVTLFISMKVRDNINSIGGGGGLHASLGNIMWFSLTFAILSVPSIWSTRGQLGDGK